MDSEIQDGMKWPSNRVPKGGIFNLPKVKYSKETHDFLNCKCWIVYPYRNRGLGFIQHSFYQMIRFPYWNIVLMEEQKLSILQRNKMNYILRSGESLPTSRPVRKTTKTNCFPAPDLLHAKNARRRTLDAIKASGGYDRAKYKSFFIPFHSVLQPINVNFFIRV